MILVHLYFQFWQYSRTQALQWCTTYVISLLSSPFSIPFLLPAKSGKRWQKIAWLRILISWPLSPSNMLSKDQLIFFPVTDKFLSIWLDCPFMHLYSDHVVDHGFENGHSTQLTLKVLVSQRNSPCIIYFLIVSWNKWLSFYLVFLEM